MSESFRRPLGSVGGSPTVRRIALVLPASVLALAALAVPAQADPPDGAGRSGDAPAQSGSLPAPDHAAAHDAIDHQPPSAGQPSTPQGPPDGVPAGPPDGVPPGPPADVPDGPPADVPAGPLADVPAEEAPPVDGGTAAHGQRVVVCKYVRKPGVAEVFSHIIVVNENALLGKGFAGVFPFPFSDAHFSSVAIRYAERGEQASEVDEASCPAQEPPGEEPPGEEPPGEGSAGEQPPGEVGGIVEDAPQAASADATGAVLPATGAGQELSILLLLGALGTLGGSWLVLQGRRRDALPR